MTLINLTQEEKQALVEQLHGASTPNLAFYVLVVLSTVIAAYGLLANSTAVVIGAMLIAPLMGPIFGITAGLIRGERRFLLSALLAELVGVLLAITIAFLIGSMPLRPDFGNEVLSRTQPTLFDLLIAFFSGLAGAYALVNPKVSPTIAGVAIATALVPPLATCGLCLASGNYRLGLGAFLLFFVNFLAIQFSAAIVFMLADLEERTGLRQGNRLSAFLMKFGPGFAALVLLGVFLTNVLVEIITQRKVESQLSRHISELLTESQGAQLNTSSLKMKGGQWEFIAEVITPQAFSPSVVGTFEESLAKKIDSPVHLVLRSVISKDCDRNGPVFISEDERKGLDAKQAEAELLQQVSSIISAETRRLPGALLTDLRRDDSGEGLAFTATMQAPDAVTPETVASLERVIRQRLGRQAGLVVRTVQTRDADSKRFVYTGEGSTRQPGPEEIALRAKIENVLRGQLPSLILGSSLQELSFARAGERLKVNASIQAPHAVSPKEVQKLQHALRTELDQSIDLVVQTSVQATASADSYLTSPAIKQN